MAGPPSPAALSAPIASRIIAGAAPVARHLCDIAGCNRPRQRWQRVCSRCFAVLPHRVSIGVVNAWRSGDRPLWRALKKDGGQMLADHLAAEHRRFAKRAARLGAVTPQQAFHNHQRLLGEQD